MDETRELEQESIVEMRRSYIVNELATRSSISVREIAQHFAVSEVTVRSDLAQLENAGKLSRVRGGAIPINQTISVSFPDLRLNVNASAKRKIADAAAELISDGSSILLDSGTTCFEFVRALTMLEGLTIITVDISIANYADAYLKNSQVLMVGGWVRKNRRYIYGGDALAQIAAINPDFVVMGTDAYSPGHGLTTEWAGVADIKRAMLARKGKHILLLDSSKLREPRLLHFGDISDMDYVVTETDKQGLLRRVCLENKTQLIVAE